MQHKKSSDENYEYENERRLLELILDKWKRILFVSLIVAAASFLALLLTSKPSYKAQGSFLVNNRRIVGVGQSSDSILTTNDVSVSQQLAKVCKLALTANSTVDKVITKGSLDMTVKELLRNLDITIIDNTNVLYLSYTCHDPQVSYKVVSTYMDILQPTLMQIGDATSVVVFDKPVLPEKKESNRKLLLIPAVLFILTAAIYIVCIIVRDMFRDTIKSVKQFKNQVGIKIVGNIPTKQVVSKGGVLKRRGGVKGKNSAFMFYESFNTLRQKIVAHNKKTNDSVFLSTSAAPHEGKSTISCGIARTLAKNNNTVLVIDLDYRQPRIAEEMRMKDPDKENCWNYVFDPSREDYEERIDGDGFDESISACIVEGRQKNVDLMLPMPRSAETPKDFDISIFERIIANVRDKYDYVLIDTPPVNIFADAVVAAEYADATMLIVRKDYAYTAQVNDAAAELEQNSRNFMGCILNEFYTTDGGHGGNYYGYYYG